MRVSQAYGATGRIFEVAITRTNPARGSRFASLRTAVIRTLMETAPNPRATNAAN